MLKIEKVILFVLKVLCLVLLFGGGFMILGSVGALERDHIECLQFFVQEVIAILCVALSFVLFVIREDLKDKCYRRIENRKLIKKRG